VPITKFCIAYASNEIGNDKTTSVCSDRQTTNGGNDNISPRSSSFTTGVQRVRQSSRYNYCGASRNGFDVTKSNWSTARRFLIIYTYQYIYIYTSILGRL